MRHSTEIRLFEAILRVFDRLTRRSPVALFVDDLQWADRSTLELLAYVTRDLASLPLLIVATCPDQASEDGARPLAQLVDAVRRGGIVELIRLRPLSDDQIDQLATSLLGQSPDVELTRFLVERSRGNPFFLHAILGQLVDEAVLVKDRGRWVVSGRLDSSAPPIIRDILAARLAPLTGEERRLLDGIALGGDWVDGSILEAVLGTNPIEIADRPARLELVVMRDAPDPRFALAHPLLREVVLGQMSAAEQRRWHAAFADAYRRFQPDDIGRLALHAQGSLPFGDPDLALDASLRAGESALSSSAGAEATAHYEFALELARRTRPAVVASVLIGLGEARQRTGDRVGAGNTWSEAIAALDPEADRREIARLHLRAATALSDVEFAAADQHVGAGLAVCHHAEGTAEPDLELALLLVAATIAHRRSDRPAVHATVARILEAGKYLSTERSRAIVSAARLLALLEEHDYLGAERELGRQELLRTGRPLLVARHLNALALIAAVKGDLPMLREVNDETVEVARQVGIPSWDFRSQLNHFIVGLYGGDWDQADEAVAEAALLGDRISHPLVTVVGRLLSAILSAYRGDHEAAIVACRVDDLIRAGAPATPARALSESALGIVELERGDADAAARLLEYRSSRMGATMPPWDLVAYGEAEARLDRTLVATEVSRRLASMAGPASWPVAMAARIDGLTAASGDRLDDAVQRLEEAAAVFRRLSMPFEEARAGIEVAELAKRAGRIDARLEDRLSGWLATFDRLGAARYADRARQILDTLDHTAAPPREATIELTPRQFEIAELVATGMSNAEIAERLFLSVRTVTSHLDHIYTRLGISSRAALAAYAVKTRQIGDA